MRKRACVTKIFFVFLAAQTGLLLPATKAFAGTVALIGASPVKTITVEEATTSAEVARGLMYRAALPEEQGMLFIFKKDAPLYFWMKNVIIDLDIIFIDKNFVIKKIHHSATPCKNSPCKIYRSGFSARYALEVAGGFCEKIWREGASEDRISSMREILTALTILLFAGCVTTHDIVVTEGVITKEKVASIARGVTTTSELKDMFGAPEMTLSRENGKDFLFKDLNLKSVLVMVDQNNVVTGYTWVE